MSTLDDLADRIERLVLRYEELQRTHALALDQIQQLTAERDSLKSRLSAARHRIDALLDRIPATPDTANPLLAVAVPVTPAQAPGDDTGAAEPAQALAEAVASQDLPDIQHLQDPPAGSLPAAEPGIPGQASPAPAAVLQQSSLLLEPHAEAGSQASEGTDHPVPVEHA